MGTVKSVEYSYPSSPNAEKFGFGNTGCYTVETADSVHGIPISHKAFANRRNAVQYATESECQR